MRAVGLLSGGLDSTIALKLILDQGVDVIALSFITPFCRCNRGGCLWSLKQAESLGIPLDTMYLGEEYLQVVKKPRFGYGSQLNPCLDCRILMFRKAKEFMWENGASFLVTGEVLGQRPMSQHLRALKLIEREAGLEGLVVRPLSAKLLPPSIPEEKGWVRREHFLAIRGRSRREQMKLSRELKISDYPCPAGGCLLADPAFARRMRDLLAFSPNFTLNDVELLKVGRHFRLSPRAKLVVGRNEEENEVLTKLRGSNDVVLSVCDYAGPVAILRGFVTMDLVELAAKIVARYSDAPKNALTRVCYEFNGTSKRVFIRALDDCYLKQLML